MAEEPRVSAFCCIGTIYVMIPNESVVDSLIKSDAGVVDGICNWLRESSVESLSVLTVVGEDISHSKVYVMYINDGNQRTKKAMRAPVVKPKRR